MSNNAHELSKRLLNALDSNYNVVDMHAVNEIISILEKINITKELLETTRLGKHVNELRRRTADAALARRAKVLVKRWRDLVIPNAVASPAHTGSNRSSAERAVRGARLGGTPLTSPALPLSRQVLSPVVISSPRPPSRPAWGGYESDSQDVILVDDDPPPPAPAPHAPPAPPAPAPHTPSKRLASPMPSVDEKKAKRDKKPKKKRGHSRAGTGAETVCDGAATGGGAWGARNGVSPSAHGAAAPGTPGAPAAPARRNGCRRSAVDAYAALVNKIPAAGVKKVKTTQELLEEIQSRGRPASPASPHSPDVVLVEPEPSPIEVESPLRNGGSEPVDLSPRGHLAGAAALTPRPPTPPAPARPVLEDERPYAECTCGDEPDETCPAAAARRAPLAPRHVHALHHALLPGVNGTRAPLHPHRFAVRPALDPDRPELFASVVPLYKYSDYADDYCVKNLARVPLAAHLPWTEFAPPPPDPPPPPAPPPPRPYPLSPAPLSDPPHLEVETDAPPDASDRLETPPDSSGDDDAIRPATPTLDLASDVKCEPTVSEFQSEAPDHRTVERAKAPLSPGPPPPSAPLGPVEGAEELSGRTIYGLWERARAAALYGYEQAGAAPTLSLQAPAVAHDDALQAALEAAGGTPARDSLSRPPRAAHFAEWHECALLGDLVALPYVVID